MDLEKVTALADALRAQDFTRVCDTYKSNWGLIDRELRHLCAERCIGHATFEVAYPKVVVIDECYNAGLARSLRDSKDDSFDAQTAVAEWLIGDGREAIDAVVAAVRTLSMTTEDWLSASLAAHGAVVQGLSGLGSARAWPTSFVSKYLHFHNADYVIYDTVAEERLGGLLRDAWGSGRLPGRVIPRPEAGTYAEAYYLYVNRFAYYMEAARMVRESSIKELDHYLWNRPEA